MRRDEIPQTDRSVAVSPSIRHTVPWRLLSVKVLSGQRLGVTFVDGTEGEVNMTDFLADSRLDGTPFEPLRDSGVFRRVDLVLGAVQWTTGADLAPDAMYDAIREHGRWMVEF